MRYLFIVNTISSAFRYTDFLNDNNNDADDDDDDETSFCPL